MASNQAKTGTIAAKAGASSGGAAAQVEAANASGTTGKADIAGDEAAKQAENAGKTDEKQAEVVVDVVKKAAETIETVVKDAAKLENEDETKKIKVLRSHPDFAYNAGEEGELPTEKADFLIAGGFAQAAGETADEAS